MALRADDVDIRRDRVLVERYQAGDTAAFDDLFRRYFDRLARYCARRVSDADTAEEIAQEAFVRALDALPRLRGDRRFYPWMTVIASRLCVDHHRRSWRTEATTEIDLTSTWDDTEALDREVDLANLGIAMARLAPRHREVLDLREREQLSYHEIAERLSVSHSTVEALLHRARRALRREFAAVTGESGRLAALPIFGWLTQRILRARAGGLGSLTKPIAATAASLAMLAAPVGIIRGTDGGSTPPAVAVDAPRSPGAAPEVAGDRLLDRTSLPTRTTASAASPALEPADPARDGLISLRNGRVGVHPRGGNGERDSNVIGAALPTLDPDTRQARQIVAQVGRAATDALGRTAVPTSAPDTEG